MDKGTKVFRQGVWNAWARGWDGPSFLSVGPKKQRKTLGHHGRPREKIKMGAHDKTCGAGAGGIGSRGRKEKISKRGGDSDKSCRNWKTSQTAEMGNTWEIEGLVGRRNLLWLRGK